MDLLLQELKEEPGLTEFRDPFNKECVEKITFWIRHPLFEPEKIVYESRIEFSFGKTKGQQDLDGNDFNDIVNKTRNFINNL